MARFSFRATFLLKEASGVLGLEVWDSSILSPFIRVAKNLLINGGRLGKFKVYDNRVSWISTLDIWRFRFRPLVIVSRKLRKRVASDSQIAITLSLDASRNHFGR